MSIVGVRELSRNASKLIDEVQSTGRPVIITKRGKPVAALHFIDEDAFEDFVLSTAPRFVAAMREADEDLASGATVPADEFFEKLRAEGD